MSLLEIESETQRYFIDNWSSTPLKLDGVSITFNGEVTDKYIQVRYVPDGDTKCLMGRISMFGTLQVYCYHKNKTQAIIIADAVKDFISEKDLPNRIRVNYGDDIMTHKLDDGFWLSLVHFQVAQV